MSTKAKRVSVKTTTVKPAPQDSKLVPALIAAGVLGVALYFFFGRGNQQGQASSAATSTQLAGLSAAQQANLSAAQQANLSAAQQANLSAAQQNLSAAQQANLSAQQANLSAAQQAHLSAQQADLSAAAYAQDQAAAASAQQAYAEAARPQGGWVGAQPPAAPGQSVKPLASVVAPPQAYGQGYDSLYYGPQPVDLAYEEYNPTLDSAPLYTTRANEYLSQANPELAAWDSTHLLPNASLSNCEDGMITDGPSFNQLNVFSGNKLFEASMAERYFTEISPPKVVSTGDLRPLPLIASSSATAVPWNQSSRNIQDVAGGLTHYNSAFCAHNAYPVAQVTTPLAGATTPLGSNPIQTSVGAL